MSSPKGWGPTAAALLLAFSLLFTFGCDRKGGDAAAATAADASVGSSNGSGEGLEPRRLLNEEVPRLPGVGRQEGAAGSGEEGEFTPQPLPAGGGGAANE